MHFWRMLFPKSRPATRLQRPHARAQLRLEVLEDRALPSSVWYVNAAAGGAANGTSWSGAFTDLQAALGAAQTGDQIWVAQCTYKPTTATDRTASFALKDGVALYGSFAGTETQLSQRDLMHNATILSGDIGVPGDNSDNSYHVVTVTGVSATAILDGFTITGGNADGAGTNQGIGGGVFSDQGTMPGPGGLPWGGGTFANLTIAGNTAMVGGGIANHGAAETITNAVFTGNTAVGLPPVGQPPAESNGAVLFNDGGTPALMNITLNGNSGGEIVSANSGSAMITNSILWGDTGPEVLGDSSVTYSDVQGGATGTGNINADPHFIDVAHGNFHIQVGSPVINAGTNNGAPGADIEGSPRPNWGIWLDSPTFGTDMGAYQSVEVVRIFTVSGLSPGPEFTNASTIHFVVQFSQPVTGFSSAGVVLGGTASPTTVQISGLTDTYDVAVSGMTQNGTVTINIPANAAHNAGGAGNNAWAGDIPSVVYDATPPVTTATLTGTLGNGGWYTGPVQVSFNATDATDGITSVSYRIDGGAWQQYGLSTPSISGDGTHTVNFYSVDQAGNTEATRSVRFKIDATTPTTTATLAGPLGYNDWHTGPVQVTLAASDATSGVASTSYKIDGGAAQTYSVPFCVTGDGTHTVAFFSVDRAGNVEATRSTTFKIDTTPPATTFQLFGNDGRLGNYSSAVRVVLTATDHTSGVWVTYYSVDGGAWHLQQGDFMVRGLGQHNVTYLSIDRAGNYEHARTVWFSIYALPPTLYVDPLTPVNLASHLKLPLAGFATSGATVAVTVTDALGRSIAATTTANALGEWSLGAVDVHTLSDGMLTVRAIASNHAGHTTQVRTTTKSGRLVFAFLQEPASTLIGHVFFAVVQMRDGFGNAMDLPGQTVTVALAPPTPTGPVAAGTLHGTLARVTTGDRAIFANLSITAGGVYRLKASDGAATALSDPFRISA